MLRSLGRYTRFMAIRPVKPSAGIEAPKFSDWRRADCCASSKFPRSKAYFYERPSLECAVGTEPIQGPVSLILPRHVADKIVHISMRSAPGQVSTPWFQRSTSTCRPDAQQPRTLVLSGWSFEAHYPTTWWLELGSQSSYVVAIFLEREAETGGAEFKRSARFLLMKRVKPGIWTLGLVGCRSARTALRQKVGLR